MNLQTMYRKAIKSVVLKDRSNHDFICGLVFMFKKSFEESSGVFIVFKNSNKLSGLSQTSKLLISTSLLSRLNASACKLL